MMTLFPPKRSIKYFFLLLACLLLVTFTVPVYADGGGVEATATLTPSPFPTWTPDANTSENAQNTTTDDIIPPSGNNTADNIPAAPDNQVAADNSSYLVPLGLLLLAILAFSAIAFLLFRRK